MSEQNSSFNDYVGTEHGFKRTTEQIQYVTSLTTEEAASLTLLVRYK